MPKSLIDDLKKLAQEILQLDENSEVNNLRATALDLFEKLTIIEHQNKLNLSLEKEVAENLDADMSNSPEIQEKENPEILSNQKEDFEAVNSEEETEAKPEPVKDLEDLFIPTFDSIKEDMSQKEEFKDTITIEETEQFFERKRVEGIERFKKKVEIKRVVKESKQLSLHDKLLSNTIQIGLNDRIAFVNNLFNFSQADFNKVLATLNDFENKKEAFDFINHTVKSKYNWKGKEDLVDRFLVIIERKYL